MMTVFTIVYNNYGKFIPQWNEYLNKQTKPVKKIVILGNNHGADLKYLKDNGIEYVECDSSNMGKLRNQAMPLIKTKWWLYFSVDDELLPEACETITKKRADAVSLKFKVIQPDHKTTKICNSPKINTLKELSECLSNSWGGYVAVKNNTDIRFNEDIEVPNYTLHFDLFSRNLKTVSSKDILAVHHRWEKSHHFLSLENGSRKKSLRTIMKARDETFDKYLDNYDFIIIKALQEYNDKEEKRRIKKGEEYKVSKARGKLILKAKFKNSRLAEFVNFIK